MAAARVSLGNQVGSPSDPEPGPLAVTRITMQVSASPGDQAMGQLVGDRRDVEGEDRDEAHRPAGDRLLVAKLARQVEDGEEPDQGCEREQGRGAGLDGYAANGPEGERTRQSCSRR